MPPFPFFHLDPDISDKVLNSLSLTELFRVSLCSGRMRSLVRRLTSSRIPQIVLAASWGSSERSSIMYWVQNASGGRSYAAWEFDDARYRSTRFYQPYQKTQINGMDLEMSCSEMSTTYFITESPEMTCLQFLPYLVDIFSAKLKASVSLQNIECFNEILSSELFPEFQSFSAHRGIVRHEEMTFMLDTSTAQRFHVSCYVADKGFSYQKPLSFPILNIHQAQWFTRDNLLNLKARQVILKRSSLKEEDFNAFIKQWLDSDGDNTDLEFIQVFGRRYEEKQGFELLDYEKICKDLPVIPGVEKDWSLSSHARGFSGYVFRFEESFDVRRKSDGMLATIARPCGEVGDEFFMFSVWHCFDPFVRPTP